MIYKKIQYMEILYTYKAKKVHNTFHYGCIYAPL